MTRWLLSVDPWGCCEEFDHEPTQEEIDEAVDDFVSNNVFWEIIEEED